MILTGQIKQLQLFWVDKRNPDKVVYSRKFEIPIISLDFYSTHDRAGAFRTYVCSQGLPLSKYSQGNFNES